MRFVNNRRDSNHGEIVSALERAGCRVADLSDAGGGVPDILVARVLASGVLIWRLMELKTKKGRMRAAQEAFAKLWPVSVVRTPEAALEAMGIEVEQRRKGGV